MHELVRKIQRKLTPDLLLPEYQKPNQHRLAGHCYIASEALYHLLPDKEDWTPMVANDGFITHWWLRHKSGKILDPTQSQFPRWMVQWMYRNGRGTGFLTSKPSRRAAILIWRVKTNWKPSKARRTAEEMGNMFND